VAIDEMVKEQRCGTINADGDWANFEEYISIKFDAHPTDDTLCRIRVTACHEDDSHEINHWGGLVCFPRDSDGEMNVPGNIGF
jgi:hypothetical protein